jgi:hypothetical protein
MNKTKIYAWYDFKKAMAESKKSLAELFDFKSGTLIDRKKEENNEPSEDQCRQLTS